MRSVDVIVPCYNYGRFLPDCVGSVLTQHDVQVRVLIIDDASTDESAAVARRLAEGDIRVNIIRHRTNQGHIATYNEGLEWVHSDYMLLLSADDLLAPAALRRAVSLMEAHKDVGLTYGRFIRFTDNDKPAGTSKWLCGTPPYAVSTGSKFIESVCANVINPIETATAIVRTAVQKQIGHYQPKLPHAADLEMWLRFAASTNVAFINEVQALIRMHPASMRNSYYTDHMNRDYQQRFEAFQSFFGSSDITYSRMSPLHASTHRNLATEILGAAARAFDRGETEAISNLMALARSIYPRTISTVPWWKLSLKILIGPTHFALIAPLIDRFRAFSPTTFALRLERRPQTVAQPSGAYSAEQSAFDLPISPPGQESAPQPSGSGDPPFHDALITHALSSFNVTGSRIRAVAERLSPTRRAVQVMCLEPTPRITVIVCTANRASALRMLLRSFTCMTIPNGVGVELVVVDNNSRDETPLVVQDAAQSLGFPVSYVFEPMPGLAAARNTGIRHAKAPLIAFTDDDCLVAEDWLAEILRHFDNDPKLGIIFGRAELYDHMHYPITICTSRRAILLDSMMDHTDFVVGCNMSFRRTVVERIGPFDVRFGAGARLKSAEDTEFVYRAQKMGCRILYTPDVLVLHNHGRTTPLQVNSLRAGYSFGDGALLMKHILGGDGQALRRFYWRCLRSLSRCMSRSATRESVTLEMSYLYNASIGALTVLGFTMLEWGSPDSSERADIG